MEVEHRDREALARSASCAVARPISLPPPVTSTTEEPLMRLRNSADGKEA